MKPKPNATLKLRFAHHDEDVSNFEGSSNLRGLMKEKVEKSKESSHDVI